MAERGELKPAYLIAGSDTGKIDAALARLRARAEREGGPGALESFTSPDGQGPPDAERLVGSIPSLSLIAARRYLVADHIQRLDAAALTAIAEAMATLPPEVTVVLVERREVSKRGRSSKTRQAAATALVKAVEAAGGEAITYEAPSARELPARLVADAGRLGFRLDAAAARLLVDRMGENTTRLAQELERLSLWAEPGGEVTAEDLDAMIADTSEAMTWTLSDAIVTRDAGEALVIAERLSAQGESASALIYQAAKRLRDAHRALLALESGRPQKEVERDLGMHPYAAKMLLRSLRGSAPEDARAGTCAIADLEWWTRGGSDYPEDVAITLAVRRAAGLAAASR